MVGVPVRASVEDRERVDDTGTIDVAGGTMVAVLVGVTVAEGMPVGVPVNVAVADGVRLGVLVDVLVQVAVGDGRGVLEDVGERWAVAMASTGREVAAAGTVGRAIRVGEGLGDGLAVVGRAAETATAVGPAPQPARILATMVSNSMATSPEFQRLPGFRLKTRDGRWADASAGSDVDSELSSWDGQSTICLFIQALASHCWR